MNNAQPAIGSPVRLYIFRGCVFSCNNTCPLVPCMAGGLAEWLRHFNDLAVGETAAPACFLRENAMGAGMPPLLTH